MSNKHMSSTSEAHSLSTFIADHTVSLSDPALADLKIAAPAVNVHIILAFFWSARHTAKRFSRAIISKLTLQLDHIQRQISAPLSDLCNKGVSVNLLDTTEQAELMDLARALEVELLVDIMNAPACQVPAMRQARVVVANLHHYFSVNQVSRDDTVKSAVIALLSYFFDTLEPLQYERLLAQSAWRNPSAAQLNLM